MRTERRITKTDSCVFVYHRHPVIRVRNPGRVDLFTEMSESRGSGLKLSLERLYKDDLGRPIPALYDITPDGRYVLEPCASTVLGVAVI
jgi:hypothetical protein